MRALWFYFHWIKIGKWSKGHFTVVGEDENNFYQSNFTRRDGVIRITTILVSPIFTPTPKTDKFTNEHKLDDITFFFKFIASRLLHFFSTRKEGMHPTKITTIDLKVDHQYLNATDDLFMRLVIRFKSFLTRNTRSRWLVFVTFNFLEKL